MKSLLKFFNLIFDLVRGVLLLSLIFFIISCVILVPLILINYLSKPVWPINMAAKYGNIPAVKALISFGSDINKNDEKDKTPLLYAYENNHAELFKFLIEKGADINIIDKNGRPIFMAAIADKKTEMAKDLVNAGADVNTTDIYKNTPLSLAISNNNTELAKFFIEKGADINKKDRFNLTPLVTALNHNELEIAKILIEKGVDVNEKDIYNRTPIFNALSKNKIEILKLLIEKGAEVNIQENFPYHEVDGKEDISHKTPLDYALGGSNNEEILCILLENGATTREPYFGRDTFLTFAIDRKYTNLIKLLAKQGVDFTEKTDYGQTPLQRALYTNNPEIINLVIDNIPDINEKINNDTILSFAILNSRPIETIKLLIERGADINTNNANSKGNSLLMSAISGGRPTNEEVPDLMQKEINRSREIAKLLIANGAKLDVKNNQGHTALKLAQIYRDEEMIKLLKEAGAKE